MHGDGACMVMVHADDHADDVMSALIQSTKHCPLLLEREDGIQST